MANFSWALLNISDSMAQNRLSGNLSEIFVSDMLVIDKNNPGQPGQYTGNCRNAGPHIMVQLSFPGGNFTYRPLTCLEAMPPTFTETIEERLRAGHFGKLRDLQIIGKGTGRLFFPSNTVLTLLGFLTEKGNR